MQKFIRVFIILILSSMMLGNAFASQAYFGVKPVADAKRKHSSTVVLSNFTMDTYTVDSTYMPTYNGWTMYLGPSGTPTDTIYYDLTYPDYAVCLTLIRNYDGYMNDLGCFSYGEVDITYGWHSTTPTIKIIK